MSTSKETDNIVFNSAAVSAFLNEQLRQQKHKAEMKRREQRDAQLMAEMHEECRYVIEGIIKHIEKLGAEPSKQDQRQPPS